MNDLIRLAIDMACISYDANSDDGFFTSAGFAKAIRKLSETDGLMDGKVVRIVLTGRTDIELMKGGSHYKRI